MRTEALRRPAWIVGWALFAAAGGLAVLLFATDWARVKEPPWLTDAGLGVGPTAKMLPRQAADFSVIWKLMEPRPKPTTPAAQPQAQGQDTYEVIATFCEDQAEFSYTVLRLRDKQVLVGVGDTIDGMKILSVTPDGVLVSRDGLQIFLKTVTPEQRATGAEVAALGPGRRAPLFVGPSERPSPSQTEEEFGRQDPFSVTPEQLRAYVDNLPTLLAQVQVRTHYDEEGQADGLQIVGLQPQSVAAQRGLRQGDIVRMVYDTPLSDLRQVPRIAQQIVQDDAAFAEVLIERDGEEQMLIYELR